MADAPSGGSSWEPFEIVLVIILLIGLLMRLDGDSSTTSTTKKTTTPSTSIIKTPDANNCGLAIARPHSLERPAGFVTLIGTTNGCNWNAKDGIALYAQVVDSRGMPVSAYTAVPAVDMPSSGGSLHFDTSISLTETPAGGIGYLILIPAQPQGDRSITSRIPLKF